MKKLTVPENIPLRWELFRGFGTPELIRTGIITGIVLAGSILFCMVSTWEFKLMAATLAVIFTMFICVNFFIKMDNNQSMYLFLKRGLRYRREQQTFWYKREERIHASSERET
ncbi:MAG: hypothetical protein VB060_08865 [Oscillibacter sp.]|uniref:hypothetical protein n=1 Tax=uncultured Oscillibacter sp. TaxID=876091 RepID=UPI0025EBB37E|nr:hypothetical protein [Oscillibacter sp.]MEA4993923.1 hypothetical protein [Oscillibacter sp.]